MYNLFPLSLQPGQTGHRTKTHVALLKDTFWTWSGTWWSDPIKGFSRLPSKEVKGQDHLLDVQECSTNITVHLILKPADVPLNYRETRSNIPASKQYIWYVRSWFQWQSQTVKQTVPRVIFMIKLSILSLRQHLRRDVSIILLSHQPASFLLNNTRAVFTVHMTGQENATLLVPVFSICLWFVYVVDLISRLKVSTCKHLAATSPLV